MPTLLHPAPPHPLSLAFISTNFMSANTTNTPQTVRNTLINVSSAPLVSTQLHTPLRAFTSTKVHNCRHK